MEKVILAFEFKSFEDYCWAWKIAGEDINPSNMSDPHLSLMYERGVEVRACAEFRFPFVVFERKDDGVDILDTNIQFDEPEVYKDLFANGRVLFRKSMPSKPSIAKMRPLLREKQDSKIIFWARIIAPLLKSKAKRENLLQRSLQFLTAKQLLAYIEDKDNDLFFKPFFVKTKNKLPKPSSGLNKIIMSSDELMVFDQESNDAKAKELPYVYEFGRDYAKTMIKENAISFFAEGETSYCPYREITTKSQGAVIYTDDHFIVSDVMSIQKDDQGRNKEYRCLVVKDEISSISRYLHDEVNEIPDNVLKFSRAVVERLRDSNFETPDIYVVDVAETLNGVEIVEFNPFENSGRYAGNCPRTFLSDLIRHYPETKGLPTVLPVVIEAEKKVNEVSRWRSLEDIRQIML